jgi:hypothetical protein
VVSLLGVGRGGQASAVALVGQFQYRCCDFLGFFGGFFFFPFFRSSFFFIAYVGPPGVDVLALAGCQTDDSVRLGWLESQSPRVANACGSSVSFGLKMAKGSRHLGLTWNRGQLMMQFREALFPYRFAWAFLPQRLRSFPTDQLTPLQLTLAHCSALPVRPDVSSHAWLGRYYSPLLRDLCKHRLPLCHTFYAYACTMITRRAVRAI